MYRPRIEVLEDRKLFSVTDLIIDPFNANVLDNNAATDDFSLHVVAAPRVLSVNNAFGDDLTGWSVRQLPLTEEGGLDASSAHTYGPRAPLSYDLKLKELLVSSYAAPHAVGKDETISIGGIRDQAQVTLVEVLVAVSGLRPAAIDRVMVDWGDGQADSILDSEYSFPRMVRAIGDASVRSLGGFGGGGTGAFVAGAADFDADSDVDGADV